MVCSKIIAKIMGSENFAHFLKQHNFRADKISNKKRLSEEQRLSRPTQTGLQGTQRTDASGAAFAVDIVDETHE